jgi:hypothetical protein
MPWSDLYIASWTMITYDKEGNLNGQVEIQSNRDEIILTVMELLQADQLAWHLRCARAACWFNFLISHG